MMWTWILWAGLMMLFFSNIGTWGYTYRAHRRFDGFAFGNDAIELLSQRYAKGEIQRDEFFKMKAEIESARQSSAITGAQSNRATKLSTPIQAR